MASIKRVAPYHDNRGNRIEYDGNPIENIHIEFTGSNNTLRVKKTARLIAPTVFRFDCNNAIIEIGEGLFSFSAFVRVGEDARISVGDHVTTTSQVMLCALEGSTLEIGNDVMISSDCQIRCDDEHPIFDVISGLRVNPAKSVLVGNHVWLGWGSRIFGGAQIGDGSVVGASSIVKKAFPNNCIISGIPAKVTRTDIAWERDHLSLVEPYFKPDGDHVKKTGYWAQTIEFDITSSTS